MPRIGVVRGFSALAILACLIGPARADGTLDWIVTAITGQSARIEEAAISGDVTRGTVVQPNDQITTGAGERMVLTHGQDVLELQPESTIAIGDSGAEGMATVIKLIDGTIHVKVGKRAAGRTFSVETRYLVATVKGTEFDVSSGNGAAAVSVSEGTVSVRSADGHSGVDVTRGRTAVSSTGETHPDVRPTPAGGAPEAAKAASKAKGSKSKTPEAGAEDTSSSSDSPKAKDKEAKDDGSNSDGSSADGNGSGNGNGNGSGNDSGSGNGNGNGNGHGGGKDKGNGKGHGKRIADWEAPAKATAPRLRIATANRRS